jgi:hypothetical protein
VALLSRYDKGLRGSTADTKSGCRHLTNSAVSAPAAAHIEHLLTSGDRGEIDEPGSE